jgi:hypothetical protein
MNDQQFSLAGTGCWHAGWEVQLFYLPAGADWVSVAWVAAMMQHHLVG